MRAAWWSQNEKRQACFWALFFAVYMFEYMVTLTFIDKGSVSPAADNWQIALHYIDYGLVMLGFATFALPLRLPENGKLWRGLLLCFGAVYGISVLCLSLRKELWSFSAAAMCAAYLLGILGGMAYYCMAMALKDSSFMGLVMVLGNSAALLAQYLFQEHLSADPVLAVMLMFGFWAVLYMSGHSPLEWKAMGGQQEKRQEPGKAASGRGTLSAAVLAPAFACVVSACLYCIGDIYDTQMLLLNVANGYEGVNLYAWPRLCAIIGLAIVGIVCDASRGKCLSLATLCVALVAILNPVLFVEPRYLTFNMCLFYINLGASLAYFNLAFWRMAPETKRPRLWAGMGRMVTNLAAILLLFAPLDRLSMAAAVALDVVMFELVVVCMAAGGELSFGERGAGSEPVDEEAVRELFCTDFHLTPREGETLALLLNIGESTQQVADALGISRRMVQRYTASICEKVGTDTRMGIWQKYNEYLEAVSKQAGKGEKLGI